MMSGVNETHQQRPFDGRKTNRGNPFILTDHCTHYTNTDLMPQTRVLFVSTSIEGGSSCSLFFYGMRRRTAETLVGNYSHKVDANRSDGHR